MKFSDLSKAVGKQFQKMVSTGLYRVKIDNEEVDENAVKPTRLDDYKPKPSKLWDTYMASFPEGSNPMHVKRTEHDCSACRGFIRKLGGVVSIVKGSVVSLWDVEVGGFYQPVVDALNKVVQASFLTNGIDNVFLHKEPTIGVVKNRQLLPGNAVKEWEHFFVNLPAECVVSGKDIGPKSNDYRTGHDVLLRSLKEIKLDVLDEVLDLIAQNSLYRGEEQKGALEAFRKIKVDFDKAGERVIRSEQSAAVSQDLFCWDRYKSTGPAIARIKNHAIGTLLVNLSEGMDLEQAVKAFEAIMAPTNYKRPTALITKAMIAKAQQKIEELGYTSALERRYATIEDITVNDVKWVNRNARKAMGIFDDLKAHVTEDVKKLEKVETIHIDKFMADVLPGAKSLEVLVENEHRGRFVSLIAPVDPTAKCMFKHGNNFSWDYIGNVTDSIKERVKMHGGKVDADFCARLAWYNNDDLDLWLDEPKGYRIGYSTARAPASAPVTGGQLDLDMNGGSGMAQDRKPVENITYRDRSKMQEGRYKLFVNQYSRRENIDLGFEVEIEFDGTTYNFAYEKGLTTREDVVVAEFDYTKKDGLKMIRSLPSTQTSKTVWGIPTQTFRPVNVVMLSPNHWENAKNIGNKHYLFMLEGCIQEGKARGIYNEMLDEALNPHRKVFEQVGARMKTDESDRQLSGLGFSSTQKGQLLCRVKGSFDRTVRVTF